MTSDMLQILLDRLTPRLVLIASLFTILSVISQKPIDISNLDFISLVKNAMLIIGSYSLVYVVFQYFARIFILPKSSNFSHVNQERLNRFVTVVTIILIWVVANYASEWITKIGIVGLVGLSIYYIYFDPTYPQKQEGISPNSGPD